MYFASQCLHLAIPTFARFHLEINFMVTALFGMGGLACPTVNTVPILVSPRLIMCHCMARQQQTHPQ